MTQDKHTPNFAGCPTPWRFVDRDGKGLAIMAADGDPVALYIDPYTDTTAQAEQIVRLWAEAPAMLESLRESANLADLLLTGILNENVRRALDLSVAQERIASFRAILARIEGAK